MYTNIYTYVYFHIDRGGLGPLLRIRNYGETQSMRRQCAIFVAEISLANGIYDNILSYIYTYPHTYIFAYMYQCAFNFGYIWFVAIHCAKSSWNPAGVETAYCAPVDVDPGTFFGGTTPKYTLVQCSWYKSNKRMVPGLKPRIQKVFLVGIGIFWGMLAFQHAGLFCGVHIFWFYDSKR